MSTVEISLNSIETALMSLDFYYDKLGLSTNDELDPVRYIKEEDPLECTHYRQLLLEFARSDVHKMFNITYREFMDLTIIEAATMLDIGAIRAKELVADLPDLDDL